MKSFLKLSTTIHLAVLLCIIFWPAIFSPKYRHRMHPVYTVELIQSQREPEPKPELKKHKPKSTKSKPKPKVKGQRVTAKSKPILPALTAPSLEEKLSKRLKELEQQSTGKPEPRAYKEPSAYTPQFKTNIPRIADFPFQWYLDFIQGKISTSWRQPQMVIARQYRAMVSFTILRNGQVRDIRIKQPSGIARFDESTLQAIQEAQPLPQLPAGYKHPQLVVNVEFRLE